MPGNGKSGCGTEVPCDIPAEMCDTEFRLTIALGRAAYNKVCLINRLPAPPICAPNLRPQPAPQLLSPGSCSYAISALSILR